MRQVTVNKAELLKKVHENRSTHREIFLKAQEGYRKKFIEVLEQRLYDAKNGKQFEAVIALQEPMDMTKEYDRVISMLEMSVDDEVELDQKEYAAYVMDDWSWKRQFVTSNAAYTDAL